jgi:hypothetical protein
MALQFIAGFLLTLFFAVIWAAAAGQLSDVAR